MQLLHSDDECIQDEGPVTMCVFVRVSGPLGAPYLVQYVENVMLVCRICSSIPVTWLAYVARVRLRTWVCVCVKCSFVQQKSLASSVD